MIDEIQKDANKRMDKSADALKLELSKMRTGRAHTGLLEHLTVPYYGSNTPLSQIASITVSDARTLTVQPWEKDLVGPVEKAIMTSGLGLNPATAGTVIRVPLPALTEEGRGDMIKIVRQSGENARVAIRNIRRDANSDFKSLRKGKEITEDELHGAEDTVQELTNSYIRKIDEVIQIKEKDLMEM